MQNRINSESRSRLYSTLHVMACSDYYRHFLEALKKLGQRESFANISNNCSLAPVLMPTHAERMRQSVLARAFDGKLTGVSDRNRSSAPVCVAE